MVSPESVAGAVPTAEQLAPSLGSRVWLFTCSSLIAAKCLGKKMQENCPSTKCSHTSRCCPPSFGLVAIKPPLPALRAVPGSARTGQDRASRGFSTSPSHLTGVFWSQLRIWEFRAQQAAAASGFARGMAAGAMGGCISVGSSDASPLGRASFWRRRGCPAY